jgi:hypothetical protein
MINLFVTGYFLLHLKRPLLKFERFTPQKSATLPCIDHVNHAFLFNWDRQVEKIKIIHWLHNRKGESLESHHLYEEN